MAVLVVGLTAAYWLGYWHGHHSRQRLNTVSSLKQIGLAFRQGHNDVAEVFAITGHAIVPVRQP